MRLSLPCLAGLSLAWAASCSPAPVATASVAQTESPRPNPRGAVTRWLSRASDDGKIHDERLWPELLAHQQKLAASPASAPVNWTLLGPGNIGGRIRSILIHPTIPSTMWVGSVSGGVWKTTNAGGTWFALPDLPAVLCVCGMALDPNNPDVLYVGTGEQSVFQSAEGTSNTAAPRGAGIFKSTDGGASFTQLAATNIPAFNSVMKIVVDRSNSSAVVAATISGIWRSTDAGATWTQRTTTRTLDVEQDPNDATKWVAGRSDGFAQYSLDGGISWTNTASFGGGRVELAYARATPNMVYATLNTSGSLSVWQSVNGGQNFLRVSAASVVSVLGNYTGAIWVDPTNSARVVVGGLDLYRSTNSGATFTKISAWASYPNSAHADHHAIVEHPQYNGTSNTTVYFGNDGGIQRTANVTTVSNTSGWVNTNSNLAITQLYACCVNPTSGVVLGGAQDNGTVRGTFTSGVNGWTQPGGGDGAFCASDPTDPNVFYMQYYYIGLSRSTNGGTSAGSNIRGAISDPAPNFINYILLDPNDPNRLYACGAQLWRTNNAKTGTPPTWTSVKPADACIASGGTGGNPPDHYIDNPPCSISTMAVARGNSNIVWVGHNNGTIYYSTNALAATPTWTRVDNGANPLPNRWVSRIVIDKDDPTKVTVSFMGFNNDNVWRTTNSGANWSVRIGSGAAALPAVPVSCILQHRVAGARFYAATDLGLYYSEDDCATWLPAPGGPTIVPIDEIVWRNDRTMVLATHGRSLWACDVDPASVSLVGAACGTPAPSLTVGAPILGTSPAFTLANAPANSPVSLLLAGGPPVPTNIGSCVVQPDLNTAVFLTAGGTNAGGSLVVNLPLPANPNLIGAVLTTQEFIVSLGGPVLGVGVLSNGARLTLGL